MSGLARAACVAWRILKGAAARWLWIVRVGAGESARIDVPAHLEHFRAELEALRGQAECTAMRIAAGIFLNDRDLVEGRARLVGDSEDAGKIIAAAFPNVLAGAAAAASDTRSPRP